MTSDKNDLSYNVTTLEGIKRKFHPTAEGLHACEVDLKDVANMFRTIVTHNLINKDEDTCHFRINDNDVNTKLAGVQEPGDSANSAGVQGTVKNSDLAEATEVNSEELAIETIKDNRKQYYKRD